MNFKDGRIEVVVTTCGVCLKVFMGEVEVSVNLESMDGALPTKFLGKRFGYKNDMAIYHNPEQLVGYDAKAKLTEEFLCDAKQPFMYGINPEDFFDALLFAQLKTKRLKEAKEREAAT